jgi:hypothetical protein
MAGAAIPLAIGAGQLAGTLISNIGGGGPDIDSEYVLEAIENPFLSVAARAADESAQRVAATQSDPLAEALARQEYERQQQQRYLQDLRATALGDQSLVAEQAAAEQVRLRQALTGQMASARGAYGQLGAMRAAPVESSLIGARAVAPTEAARQQESDKAMQMYLQALGQQGEQGGQFLDILTQQRRARRGSLLAGEQLKQYGAGQSTTSQAQEGKGRLSEQIYQ